MSMRYCRHENAYNELRECWARWDDGADSETEERFRKKLIMLCRRITEETPDKSSLGERMYFEREGK